MPTELRLAGATIQLDDQALEALAQQLAGRISEIVGEQQANGPATWIRGAQAAAEYLSCPRSRVYELLAREPPAIRHKRDGQILMFRPEWLDEALEDGVL